MRALILLTIVGSAFAVPRVANRIVGGDETTIEKYPFTANMQYAFGSTWAQYCAGSLLTTTVILSAASCFEGDDNPAAWRAILGSSFSMTSFVDSIHPVSEFVLHPQYNKATKNNDIAIVRLSVPAVYSNTIQPARIAGRNYYLPDRTQVTSIGWGALFHEGWTAGVLQHVDINLINHRECARRYMTLKETAGYESWPDVTDGMLCAGILDVGGKGACQLDEGGPLLHQGDIVIGITSWSYKCADEQYPGVYTRVSQYSDWIVANA